MASPAADDDESQLELDLVLGVRLASPQQAAAWAALRADTEAHLLRRAWVAWRAAAAAAPEEAASPAASASAASDDEAPRRLDAVAAWRASHADAGEGSGDESFDAGTHASSAARAVRLAAFATARRLRSLHRGWRALRDHAWLQREVWRRGRKALLARNGACATQRRAHSPSHCMRVCSRAARPRRSVAVRRGAGRVGPARGGPRGVARARRGGGFGAPSADAAPRALGLG